MDRSFKFWTRVYKIFCLFGMNHLMFWWDMLQEVGFRASLYRQVFYACGTTDFCFNNGLLVWKIILLCVVSIWYEKRKCDIKKWCFLTWFDIDRYIGWLHAVLLITGHYLQWLLTTSLWHQPNVSGAYRKGTRYPSIHGQHVNIQASPRCMCCPWIQWYCGSKNKSMRLYH